MGWGGTRAWVGTRRWRVCCSAAQPLALPHTRAVVLVPPLPPPPPCLPAACSIPSWVPSWGAPSSSSWAACWTRQVGTGLVFVEALLERVSIGAFNEPHTQVDVWVAHGIGLCRTRGAPGRQSSPLLPPMCVQPTGSTCWPRACPRPSPSSSITSSSTPLPQTSSASSGEGGEVYGQRGWLVARRAARQQAVLGRRACVGGWVSGCVGGHLSLCKHALNPCPVSLATRAPPCLCRPHDGTVLWIAFRWIGLFREWARGGRRRRALLLPALCADCCPCVWSLKSISQRTLLHNCTDLNTSFCPPEQTNLACPPCPCLPAGPRCERDECMIRTTPSFRSGRHYGSFLLIQARARHRACVHAGRCCLWVCWQQLPQEPAGTLTDTHPGQCPHVLCCAVLCCAGHGDELCGDRPHRPARSGGVLLHLLGGWAGGMVGGWVDGWMGMVLLAGWPAGWLAGWLAGLHPCE